MTDAALCLAAAVVARLRPAALLRFGALLGWVAGSVLRVRRALVESAMRRAGVIDPAGTAARMYRDLGRGLVELLWLAGAAAPQRAEAIARVTIDDDALSALECGLERGPVILFASHTGNWEVAAAAAAQWLARKDHRLFVVAKAIRTRGIDRFTSRLREALGIGVIPPDGAFSAARRALAAGDVVAMPIDQVPDRAVHGSAVTFLGAPALVDRAPAMLAYRARATVLVVAAERDDERHRVRLLHVIPPSPADEARGSWSEVVTAVTASATSQLDAFVRSSPESWLWLHRRWRMPRGDRRPSGTRPRSRVVASPVSASAR